MARWLLNPAKVREMKSQNAAGDKLFTTVCRDKMMSAAAILEELGY